MGPLLYSGPVHRCAGERAVPHSSRGLGHRPLKAEITGSNPVCGTSSPTRSRSRCRRAQRNLEQVDEISDADVAGRRHGVNRGMDAQPYPGPEDGEAAERSSLHGGAPSARSGTLSSAGWNLSRPRHHDQPLRPTTASPSAANTTPRACHSHSGSRPHVNGTQVRWAPWPTSMRSRTAVYGLRDRRWFARSERRAVAGGHPAADWRPPPAGGWSFVEAPSQAYCHESPSV